MKHLIYYSFNLVLSLAVEILQCGTSTLLPSKASNIQGRIAHTTGKHTAVEHTKEKLTIGALKVCRIIVQRVVQLTGSRCETKLCI